MTDKSEPENSCASCAPCGEGGKIWMVALAGFLVGLLVMYIAMPALAPAAPEAPEAPAAGAQEAEEKFVLDEAKALEIGNLLADTFFLNTGEEVPVSYMGYEEEKSHLVLYYNVMGEAMPVYASKDYRYLYPSAIDRAEMAEEVAVVKAQFLAELAVQAQQPAQTISTQEEDPSIEFASCLTENGAVFYGTEWCGYCGKQKEMFGETFEEITYVDCGANPEACQEAGIEAYPTWVINGEKHTGMKSLAALSSLTGCEESAHQEP